MSKKDQKIKLLILHDILKLQSDEDHPLTTSALCNELKQHGIECDRRTLPNDIEKLNKFDYEVMQTKVGKEYAYYVEERSFTIPELKILIDALQAASFITTSKTNEMIGKIARLSSNSIQNLLKENIIIFNRHKHTNESILYNVDYLTRGIIDNKQVSFYYFTLNENGKKIYHKEKTLYIVNPVSLVYLEDYYYLITYNEKYNHTTSYRVDRMETVSIEDHVVHEKAILLRNEVSLFTDSVFKMFSGDFVNVTFQFKNNVINPFFDKFGEKVSITKVDDIWYQSTVTVQPSPTFYGWISTFSDSIKVIKPESVRHKIKSQLQKTLELYD